MVIIRCFSKVVADKWEILIILLTLTGKKSSGFPAILNSIDPLPFEESKIP